MAGNDDIKKKIGEVLPGQGWVELHGTFTFHELRAIAQSVEKKVKIARNGNKNGHL